VKSMVPVLETSASLIMLRISLSLGCIPVPPDEVLVLMARQWWLRLRAQARTQGHHGGLQDLEIDGSATLLVHEGEHALVLSDLLLAKELLRMGGRGRRRRKLTSKLRRC
jgi:hypothetical protein